MQCNECNDYYGCRREPLCPNQLCISESFQIQVLWWHFFEKVDIYLHTKFPYQISMKYLNPLLRQTTSGFGKRMAAILKFYFWFLFFGLIRHRSVILHWPTKFHQNQTTLCGVMTSYRLLQDGGRQPYWIWSGYIRSSTKCNSWSQLGPHFWSWLHV